MIAPDYNLAAAYVHALTGDVDNAIMDWRALHDTEKGDPGHARRGTLAQWWNWLVEHNQRGYGIFVTPALLDGHGRKLENVSTIRAHYVDLDNQSAEQNFTAAQQHLPPPSFAVGTSAGKYHVYWVVNPYTCDIDRFELLQRKLRQMYDGDKAVIDAARVMRLPGTLHMKNPSAPSMVSVWSLGGMGQPITVEQLESSVTHVQVIDGGVGERHELGDPDLAAPSLAWLKRSMELVDPNDLDRGEWVAMMCAIKQSGWTLTDEATLYAMFTEWCARYHADDPAENHKNWRSITSTELGWKSIVRRVPSLKAILSFGENAPQAAVPNSPMPGGTTPTGAPPMPAPQPLDCSGEMLTHLECAEWFKGCVYVAAHAKILTPTGAMYNVTQFNGSDYAGKKFIVTQEGKSTDEPWKAATRSTMWTVPKVHNIRFLPSEPPGAIVTDVIGRRGVNTYVKPDIDMIDGDVSPFLAHIEAIIPDANDRKILFDWMAHVVKFPGFKIPWAPVIQSTEGIGKGVIKLAMTHAIGAPYVHFPDAQQLGDSGGKFNGWMRGKVFILADEIKVDEKRHLVEVLKPLISEETIEVQSKGVDQEMEDIPANWGFFTNYKDAVPVSRNGRRYAIFYSPLQTEQDIMDRGMGDDYMKQLFAWLKGDGKKIVAHWLHNYPIERGSIPMRAPKTTSWEEAVEIGRSPIERVLTEAITAGAAGFRGGWVSEIAAVKRVRESGVLRSAVPPHAIKSVLEGMGYRENGRQVRPYFAEDKDVMGTLYSTTGALDVAQYGTAQGYE